MKKRPDVLLRDKLANANGPRPPRPANGDSDVDMSDAESSEEEGESVGSDGESDEEEQDEDPQKNLPRAANGKVKTSRGRNERVMAPEECRAHLRHLFKNEHQMCSLLYGKRGPFATPDRPSILSADIFFMDVVPVAPTCFRPPAKMGETLFEHPQNELLSKVLTTSYRLRDLNLDLQSASTKNKADYDEAARKVVMGQLLNSLIQLQIDVNSFMDSGKNPQPMRQGKLPPAGVKQGLEKKEGLFRKHMMVCSFSFCRSLTS